jgi:hypothetical protein
MPRTTDEPREPVVEMLIGGAVQDVQHDAESPAFVGDRSDREPFYR